VFRAAELSSCPFIIWRRPYDGKDQKKLDPLPPKYSLLILSSGTNPTTTYVAPFKGLLKVHFTEYTKLLSSGLSVTA